MQRRFFKHIDNRKESPMFKPAIAIALMACSMPAFAANDYPSARIQAALPSEAMTVTDWYKQNVYDPNENKIGDIKDVLVDKSGKVVALIVGVGGFLGAGEKDVAVPFEAVHPTMKDKKWWLVMNTTKDSLKSAPGFKYDSNTTTWVPDRP
jgi:sporulation protein YlmC with PRC-barrel domain